MPVEQTRRVSFADPRVDSLERRQSANEAPRTTAPPTHAGHAHAPAAGYTRHAPPSMPFPRPEPPSQRAAGRLGTPSGASDSAKEAPFRRSLTEAHYSGRGMRGRRPSDRTLVSLPLSEVRRSTAEEGGVGTAPQTPHAPDEVPRRGSGPLSARVSSGAFTKLVCRYGGFYGADEASGEMRYRGGESRLLVVPNDASLEELQEIIQRSVATAEGDGASSGFQLKWELPDVPGELLSLDTPGDWDVCQAEAAANRASGAVVKVIMLPLGPGAVPRRTRTAHAHRRSRSAADSDLQGVFGSPTRSGASPEAALASAASPDGTPHRGTPSAPTSARAYASASTVSREGSGGPRSPVGPPSAPKPPPPPIDTAYDESGPNSARSFHRSGSTRSLKDNHRTLVRRGTPTSAHAPAGAAQPPSGSSPPTRQVSGGGMRGFGAGRAARSAVRPRQPQAPPDGSPPDPDAAHAGSTGHSAGRSSRNISPGRLIEPHTPLGAASTEMNDQHPSTGPSGNTSRASTAPSPRPSAPSPRQPAPPALAEEGEFSEVELQGHLTSAVRSQMLAKKRFSQAQPRNAYHVVNDADAGGGGLMPEESGLLKVDGAPMRAGWGTPGSTEAGSNAHSEFGSQAPMSGLSANPLMTRLNMFANRANSLHDPSSRGDHSSQGTQRSTAAALPPRQPSGGLPVSFHAPVSPQSGALSDEEDGSLNDSISHGSLARASGGAQAEPAKKEGGHARTPSGASGRPSRPAHRGAQDSMQSIQSFSFEGGLGSEGNVASSADADSGPAPGPQWSGATSERLRAPAPAPAPAPAKGGPRKPPGLAVQGLHVEVGSQLAQGQWTDSGQWQEAPPPAAEPSLEMFASGVQRIPIEDLKKVKELGRGQFGSVWHERWRGVDVAVKEMHSVDPKSRAEMFREAVTLASLRHPCVVNFYGIVADNSIAATVLEYVRDGSLKAALCKLRQAGLFARWPPRRVDAFRVRCALGAARGMEYMHSQKVVHFDLKCDNLLCDLSNLDAPRVKISDVGLSKQKATTFISGNMRGTLPWMAPELFPGLAGPAVAPAGDAGLVNEKVDVYSFAVVMWEVWTLGQPPYSKLAMGAVLSGVIAGNLRPPVPQGCRPAWAALMQECWRPAPRARPGFPEICDRLEAMLEDVLREEEASRAGGE